MNKYSLKSIENGNPLQLSIVWVTLRTSLKSEFNLIAVLLGVINFLKTVNQFIRFWHKKENQKSNAMQNTFVFFEIPLTSKNMKNLYLFYLPHSRHKDYSKLVGRGIQNYCGFLIFWVYLIKANSAILLFCIKLR